MGLGSGTSLPLGQVSPTKSWPPMTLAVGNKPAGSTVGFAAAAVKSALLPEPPRLRWV